MWPNIDIGSDIISKKLRLFREKNKKLKIHFLKISHLRILLNCVIIVIS